LLKDFSSRLSMLVGPLFAAVALTVEEVLFTE